MGYGVAIPFPASVTKWLDEQPEHPHNDSIKNVLLQYADHLYKNTFMSEHDIYVRSMEAIQEEFERGPHTKMLSKRMLARLDGKVLLYHSHKLQTAVFTEITAKHRRKVGHSTSVINYFKSDGGYVYILRRSDIYPDFFIFTGHFFDRLLERRFNTDDHAARMQAVMRLMRHIDRKIAAGGFYSFCYWPKNNAYMAVFGGLGLGTANMYTELPEPFNFPGWAKTSKMVVGNPPPERSVYFMLTYVDGDKLCPEQKYIYDNLIGNHDKKVKLEEAANEG